MRVTVDGGTEKWLQWMQKNNLFDDLLLPEIITGDMDSLSKEILNHFTTNNDEIKVVVTPNQDETDFFKALRELSTYTLDKNIQVCNLLIIETPYIPKWLVKDLKNLL